jgi:hypothetical protein
LKAPSIRACLAASLLVYAWQAAAAQSGTGRVIRGTVYDSLAGPPLAGARVTLVGRAEPTHPAGSATSDSAGHYELTGVGAGAYLIDFQHPLLDSLDITTRPRQVQLAATGAPFVVNLAVPSARTVHDAFCPAASHADSTSVLIGHLSDARSRGVIADGVVTAQWLAVERSGKRLDTTLPTITATSSADGAYLLCGLPAATRVVLQARTPSNASAVISILTPPRTSVIRRAFYLTDSAAPRAGGITGVVQSAHDRQPIARAQVRVAGDTSVAVTGADGRFSLRHVPYGTLAVDARSIGFAPQEQDVDVLPDARARVVFSLSAPARNTLDTVRTYASLDATGFEARRKAGWGRYFDADDIRRIHASDVNDIVRGVPGVRETGLGFHAQVLMVPVFGAPQLCVPSYYLDGRRLTGVSQSEDLEMFVQPQELAGVEVYASPIDTPPQFRELGAVCGSIVMWTHYAERRTPKGNP